MKIIKPNGMKILKFVHLLCAFMWIGGAVCMALLLFGITPNESHEMYIRSLALKKIDDWLIITGVIGCVTTGIIYSTWSKWKGFKHRWIIIKWILTLAMITLGTFIMAPYVNDNVYPTSEIYQYTSDNVLFWYNVSKSERWGNIQIILLIITVFISVYKPKFNTKKKQ